MDISSQLYQIGFTRLLIWSEDDNWVQDDSAVGKAENLLYSPRIAPVNTQFQRDKREIQWGGLVLGSNRKRRDQVLQELRSQVGLPQPIISYVYINHDKDIGCGCKHCTADCTLIWLEAVGEITRVRPRSSRGGTGIPELEITVALHSHWRGLNRYHWYWGSIESKQLGQKSPSSDYYSVIESRDWVNCHEIFDCDTCHVWEYQDYTNHDYRFDPDYWDALLNTSQACQSHRAGKAATWTTGFVSCNLFVDQSLWGAEPISIYAFRQLPQTGKIYLNVSYRRGVNQKLEQTVLNLADINQAIVDAAQGNLLPTDELFIGDILERSNGKSYPRAFIRRNGEILPNVFIPIEASPQYIPGKVGTGHAQVTIISPNGVETAYQHIYQRM